MQNYIYNIKNISFKKIKNAQECFTDQEYITNINMINFGNKLTNLYFIFGGCHNLINVSNFNTSNVINMSSMFYGCYNLIDVPNFDTSNVETMHDMFDSCYNLKTIPNFDTSNVINMSEMFTGCDNLTGVPNLNTINVTNMSQMFISCTNLTTIPNFDTSNVTDMHGMFFWCFGNLKTIPNFNTINVINISEMFYDCESLHSIPNLYTNNANDMHRMFFYCTNLINIPNLNTANVINMWAMFWNCNNLTTVPNLNTSSVTDMEDIFWNCTNLTQNTLNWIASWVPPYNQLTSPSTNSLTYFGLSNNQINIIRKNLTASNMAINNGWNIPLITNYSVLYKTNVDETEWTDMGLNNILISDNAGAVRSAFINNTPNKNAVTNLKVNSLPEATNLSYLFNNMYNLQEVNELNILDAKYMNSIFRNCRNLTNISNFNTSNVINMSSMFYGCYNLIDVPNFDTSKVTDMTSMFRNCKQKIIVPNFNTINVTNMYSMFIDSGLTNAPNFDTSNVTDMSWMFKSCSILANISNFNTINVANMSHMFYSCEHIIEIPNFDTSNVKYMNSMFTQCRNLITVPNFNTSKVTNMEHVFWGCSNLTNIPNFNTNNVVNIAEMFSYCNSLIEVFNFNTNNVVNIANMFYACYNLSNNSLENIAYSIPYYSNITDINKWPMLNYIGLSETQINNLSAAAIEFVENRGWFVQPQIKIEYTLLNGYSGNNRIFISGMNGIEQCQNLSNIIVTDTQNNAVTLNILGTSSNIELISLLNYKGRYLTDLNFGINTINTTNGYRAFELCHNLKNINGLKTNNIINGYLMFSNCENLQPSWNEWNFNNVINGTQMFCNIGGFISNFSIPNLSFANLDCATAMFRSVWSNYANITDVSSNIYMPKVTDMGLIFASCSNLSLNALQNIVTFIPDYTQLNSTTKASGWSDWDNSYYGTLQYLGLSIEQIDLLPDKYKQMAADKHWNVPGFIAREKASILPICNNLGAISNYISNNSYTEIPMILSYKDEYEDYCLESQNQGVANSTSSAIITIPEELITLCGSEYTFTFYYSGESNCDYLTIYRNGTEIKKCNGNNGSIYLQDTLYLEDIVAGDIFQFTFRKDGSVNTGLDGCLIFITGYKGEGAYEITYSLVEDPDTLLYKIIPKEEN